jgi:hypothetical protein
MDSDSEGMKSFIAEMNSHRTGMNSDRTEMNFFNHLNKNTWIKSYENFPALKGFNRFITLLLMPEQAVKEIKHKS